MNEVQPTKLQEKTFENMVEKGLSAKRAMIESGYSKKTAINPSKLTKSRGFEILCKRVGLTDNLILKSLVEDIKKKPQKRIEELKLAANIRRLTAKENIDGNVFIPIQVIIKNGNEGSNLSSQTV